MTKLNVNIYMSIPAQVELNFSISFGPVIPLRFISLIFIQYRYTIILYCLNYSITMLLFSKSNLQVDIIDLKVSVPIQRSLLSIISLSFYTYRFSFIFQFEDVSIFWNTMNLHLQEYFEIVTTFISCILMRHIRIFVSLCFVILG